jgi:hypothetical protein
MRRGRDPRAGGEARCSRVSLLSHSMLIRVDPPILRDDLIAALQRANCNVSLRGEDEFEVSSPSPILTTEQARREIFLYVTIWRARNPRAEVEFID